MQKNNDFNKLKSNRDKRNIHELMDKAHKLGSRIIAWKDVDGVKITVDVFIRTLRKARNELEIFTKDPESTAYQQVMVGNKDVNLYIPDSALLFQSAVLRREGLDANVIKFPEMVAQVERRKHLRLNLVGDTENKICCFFYKTLKMNFIGTNIQTQYFEKNCHDISAGGISLVLPRPAAKFFNQGELIPQIYVAIEGEEVKVDGAVVAKVPIEPNAENKLHYKGMKICLEFKNLSDDDKKVIEDFVFKNISFEKAV